MKIYIKLQGFNLLHKMSCALNLKQTYMVYCHFRESKFILKVSFHKFDSARLKSMKQYNRAAFMLAEKEKNCVNSHRISLKI